MIPKPVLRSNYRATIIHNFLGAFVGSISGLADLHQHFAATAVRDPVFVHDRLPQGRTSFAERRGW